MRGLVRSGAVPVLRRTPYAVRRGPWAVGRGRPHAAGQVGAGPLRPHTAGPCSAALCARVGVRDGGCGPRSTAVAYRRPRESARTGGSAAAAPAAATAATAATRRRGRCGRRPARGDGDRRQELHRVVVPGRAGRGGGGLRHRAAEFEGVAAGPAAVLVARHAHRLARDGRARGVTAPAPSRIGTPPQGSSAATRRRRREEPAPGTSRPPHAGRARRHPWRHGRRYPYPGRDGYARTRTRGGKPGFCGRAADTGQGTAHTAKGTAARPGASPTPTGHGAPGRNPVDQAPAPRSSRIWETTRATVCRTASVSVRKCQ